MRPTQAGSSIHGFSGPKLAPLENLRAYVPPPIVNGLASSPVASL